MVIYELNIFEELAQLLASMDPKKVLHFKVSEPAQHRMEALQFKSREASGGLSEPEKQEIERYLMVDHIVRLAKIHARERLTLAA